MRLKIVQSYLKKKDPGVNPSLTITAMSERAAGKIYLS